MSSAMTDETRRQRAVLSVLVSRIVQVRELGSTRPGIDISVPRAVGDAFFKGEALPEVEEQKLASTVAPNSVVPVRIAWRRRSTTEEVTNLLSEVEQGHRELRDSVDNAARISEKVLEGVEVFQHHMRNALWSPSKGRQQEKKQQASADHFGSLASTTPNTLMEGHANAKGWLKLFRWAVHRIILQERVRKTREYLSSLERGKRERQDDELHPLRLQTNELISQATQGGLPSPLKRVKATDVPVKCSSTSKIKHALMMSEV